MRRDTNNVNETNHGAVVSSSSSFPQALLKVITAPWEWVGRLKAGENVFFSRLRLWYMHVQMRYDGMRYDGRGICSSCHKGIGS